MVTPAQSKGASSAGSNSFGTKQTASVLKSTYWAYPPFEVTPLMYWAEQVTKSLLEWINRVN